MIEEAVYEHTKEHEWDHVPWLMPPWGALAVYATAGVLHVTDADHLWVGVVSGILAVVATGAVFLGVLEERTRAKWAAFTAATAISAGAWLTWTTVSGEWLSWAALSTLICGLVVLWPIYAGLIHHGDRVDDDEHVALVHLAKEVQQAKTEDVWVRILTKAGVSGAEIAAGPIPQPAGFKLRCHSTVHAEQVKGMVRGIETHASRLLRGTHTIVTGSIQVEPCEAADEFWLHVTTENVTATDHVAPDDEIGPTTVNKPILLGLFRDGLQVLLDLVAHPHMVIVGAPGSGKSWLIHRIIACLTRCTDTLVWLGAGDKFWPLAGPWLKPWMEGRTDTPVLDFVAPNADRVGVMLAEMYRLIDIRQGIPRTGDKITPSPENPLIVGIVEEWTGVAATGKIIQTHNGPWEISALAHEVKRLGRSEAARLILLAHGGTAGMLGAMGARIKASAACRICLRTNAPAEAGYVLNDARGVQAHKIEHPGVGYIEFTGSRPLEWRGITTNPDTEVPAIAERHTQYVSSLPENQEARMGEAYRDRWSHENTQFVRDYMNGGVASEPVSAVAVAAPPAAAKPASGGMFGPVPDLAAVVRKHLNPDATDNHVQQEEKGADDTNDVDNQFADLTANLAVRSPVPEPLNTILEKFRDDNRTYIPTSELAAAVDMDPVKLGLALAKLSIPRVEKSREADGESRRGWPLESLRHAAAEYRRGERPPR